MNGKACASACTYTISPELLIFIIDSDDDQIARTLRLTSKLEGKPPMSTKALVLRRFGYESYNGGAAAMGTRYQALFGVSPMEGSIKAFNDGDGFPKVL